MYSNRNHSHDQITFSHESLETGSARPSDVMLTDQTDLRLAPSAFQGPELLTHADFGKTADKAPEEALNEAKSEGSVWLEKVRPEHHGEAQEILEENPAAFGAYLKVCYLPDQPQNITDHFDTSYLGSYQTIDHWAEDFFELIGGSENLRRLQEDNEWPEDLLTWSPDAAVKFSQHLGIVIEEDNEHFHVFLPAYLQAEKQREKEQAALLEEWEQRQAALLPEHVEAAGRVFSRDPHAFLAYLDRFYRKQAPDDVEQEFDSIYVGSYNTPEEWAVESFEVLGWAEAVQETQNAAGIPENILRLDVDEFLDWAQNSMGFEILSGGNRVHIFQT